MTKNKIISFGVAFTAISAVTIGAAAKQSNLLFRAGATYEPYYCIYGDYFADITVDEEDSSVAYATSRELTLGFSNFTYNSENAYLSYESDNNIYEESEIDIFEYASFWNIQPVHGLLGGNVLTHPIFEEDGETNKAFNIYAIFADHPMTNVNDPIKAAFSEGGTGLLGLMFSYEYGVLSATAVNGGNECSIVPEDLDTPLEIFVGDGTNPETGRFGDVLRYLGSFEYFYVAFYGNVAIDSITIAYTCVGMPDDLIYEAYPCSHGSQTLSYNSTSHYYVCDVCGEHINEEAHSFAYDGYCSECGYYDASYDQSSYEE